MRTAFLQKIAEISSCEWEVSLFLQSIKGDDRNWSKHFPGLLLESQALRLLEAVSKALCNLPRTGCDLIWMG
jgi:transcription elongation factor GreA-like protein